ncbi:conserved hypothetical protein [Hyella patelloides LEGE 07179]|uniref:DUF3122 domain-containing protein n=1 Tax=Hyella patelloides LEGE 07179 TaxID=945734 RepID=A0A563VLI3_9CYAN|nr:DUF3122 domain-containing protein [Hyella patelloides]VEP12299.1 conserved hypothetical protein [Hyella patelloides LEGE 07179]
MLRHVLHNLELAIACMLATLILFMIISLLTIQPAIGTITETDIAPGQIHCRSEQVLTDEAGHKWEIMLFTNQVDFPQVASLNLRLSGLSSSLRIQSQKPLVVNDSSDLYEVSNIFLEKSPLPSIGQYDLKKIIPQLSTEKLLLEIPLENGKSSRLHIPQTMVQEWQEVAAKTANPSQKFPSNFQLVC